jgi:hypothetical protein
MPSNGSTKAKRASATNPIELRPLKPIPPSDASEAKQAPVTSPSEPAGRPAQGQSVEEAMARQNIQTARSPGAVGPIGRSVLLVAVLTLVGLVAVWVLLVF